MKLYQTPGLAVVGGVPEITGGLFVLLVPLVTVIENAGSDAVPPLPSLTLILMFEYVPTLALDGTADSWHFVLLNDNHAGLFWIEQRSASPSASEIVAMKLYQTPTLMVVGGVPEILGAAAYALNGASNTAKSERATAIMGTRATRARAFLSELGMRIPIETYDLCGVARDAARTRTPKIPYRRTRSWSAIARLKPADATER